jgi:predicted dehydrogenase
MEKSMNKIKLGLIGLGAIGNIHLGNCLKLENAELIAVSDISRKALNVAKEKGIKKTYRDYKKLLKNSDLDAVIIALPNHLHAPCVKEAAEAGKHILLEKPIARNMEEGKQIVSTTTRNNIKLMVGYSLRFKEPYRNLKEQIESGEIGEVQLAHATNIGSGPFIHRAESGIPGPIPEWWLKRELIGGGALMDLGCHMINLLHWYFGDVSHVKSYFGYRFNLDIEDHAICLLQFQAGQTAMVNVGWFSQKNHIRVALHGTLGNAYITNESSNKRKTAIQRIVRRRPELFTHFLRELSYFVQCIQNDSKPSLSGEEALRDLETISKAYGNQIHLD